MNPRRPAGTPRFLVVLVVGVLLASTCFTLLHWHKGSTDQGCQLCHVRHLPSLHSVTAGAYAFVVSSECSWDADHSGEALDTCVRNASTRAPPFSIS